VPKAAGAQSSSISFYEEPDAGEGSGLLAQFASARAVRRRVEMVSLDDEMENRGEPTIDALKIDAEGCDLEVLRGASALIAEQAIRFIQFEYNSHWRVRGATLLAAETLLREAGYETFLIDKQGLYRSNVMRYGEYFAYSNYLATRRSDVTRLSRIIIGKM